MIHEAATTETIMKPLIAIVLSLVSIFLIHESASADPVVYKLYAVTDGKLGARQFSQAEITISFRGNTRNVSIQTQPGGAIVYQNNRGKATVTLVQNGKKTVANIAEGQIYVRYDTTNGVVGFGSTTVGPFYPIAISCNVGIYTLTNCFFFNSYPSEALVSALADYSGNPSLYSGISILPTDLSETTVVSGYVSACAVDYGNSIVCPAFPVTPIHTDLGDLYLRDLGDEGKGIFTVTVGTVEEDDASDNVER
jgi:hypothetical protein